MRRTSTTTTLKHREVARELRREIESGQWQPGEQIPGEQDLKVRFGVAYMTIRQAVTNLVDDGLLLRVRGKGTFVAQNRPAALIGTRHPMAFLFPAEMRHGDPYYFPEVLAGFQRMLEEHGHRASLHNDDDSVTAALEPGTAVACLLFDQDHIGLIESLRDAGHPVLAINHYRGRRSIPCVRINDEGGVELAVDHLVSLGHKRIGFIVGRTGNIDAADRLRGFRAAVKRHGLTDAPEAGDGFTEDAGYRAASALLALPNPPTAIACASDLSAIGAMKAARDEGLSIPGDFSIVGFGDFSIASYMHPALTTIRQGRFQLGRSAAEALIHLANDEAPAGSVLDVELVIRHSATVPVGGDSVTR